MDGNDAMIQVEHISKQYKEGLVLDDVTFSCAAGKICGIVGKNGSGKSMLFKVIAGFVRPTAGTVRVAGKVVGRDVDFPDDMGVIIETPGAIPYYSGFKNLKLLAQLRDRIGNLDIEKAMQTVGLDPKNKKAVSKYSLGMKQRLGIAQAIMENPAILILDEPMNGLDKTGIAQMRLLFRQMADDGRTILLTSHNNEDIAALCDSVYEMDNGRLTFLPGAAG
ncbi:MAG: ATP-binding cassette domain-containing protein [Eubacteriales bacterium]|nr:ATP-binding cassette domain-containing protein [Eubacteriales bacterium]